MHVYTHSHDRAAHAQPIYVYAYFAVALHRWKEGIPGTPVGAEEAVGKPLSRNEHEKYA